MIEVWNSCIKITDCKEIDKNIGKYLSVWDKTSFKYSWCAFHYDEENKIWTLPKINPWFVQKNLKAEGLRDCTSFERGKKAVYKLKVKPRSNVQADAIEFLLNENNTRKMLCLKPGEGKTYCTINYLCYKKERSLIIVDQDRIINQWKESFLKFTDIHESEVFIISGINTINKIMNEKKDLPYKVFIASHRTLASFMQDNPNNFNEFINKYGIGIKVIDEAHVEVRNTVMLDGFSNVAETIYLTATPKRSNPIEDVVYQRIFKSVAKFDSTSSRQKKYHQISLISYNSNPSIAEEGKCSNPRGFDLNAYSKYLFTKRKEKIFTILDKLVKTCLKKKGKIAIVIHNLEHIEEFKDHLCNYVDEKEIGLFCGLVKKDKDKELDKRVILTTEKGFNKAVDVPDLRFLIMTVPTSSEVIAEQLLGRLRPLEDGRNVMYFDLTDIGFKACKVQRNKRKKTFDKFATKFIELNL